LVIWWKNFKRFLKRIITQAQVIKIKYKVGEIKVNNRCRNWRNVGNNRDFSKKMIISFALFITGVFILSNIIIISSVWTIRFYEENRGLKQKISEVETHLNKSNKENSKEYLGNLSYEGYYLKITDEKGYVVFDNLTKYLRVSKSSIIEKHQEFLRKEQTINYGVDNLKITIQKNLSDDRKTFAHFGFIFVIMNFVIIGTGFHFSKKLTYKSLMPINDEIGRLGRVINDMMDRLENSFVSQNKFISDASHELKTPLQILKGYSELLASWGMNDEKIRDEALRAIQEEIVAMTGLIEKLLLLAKFDNNAMQHKRDSVDLVELIKKVSAGIILVYPQVKINFSSEESVFYICDRELIRQALIALIDNSSKYTYGKGEIDIYLDNSENSGIKIVIKDNGIGIDSEFLDKVFDRFYRADESRTKETGGTGLGLSIVKNIVEIHKGTINIESRLGKGTSIIIKLPKF